ncbi:MAG: 4-(cytidine 5'-diphospho)-2-C-methyl-D-erythritol kinase, partial [Clostridia bacterium]|nr:4-(cytidine 5'-diphospho)-2-C-methyl-D-erythritol kinase [Clostridia bacterium]
MTVRGCRPDGYHEIESVMQQVSLADILLFEPSPIKGWCFFCTDPDLSGYDNLVCQAVRLLEEQANKPLSGVKITLFKRIPVEAGLAGGSSDAAATLLTLNGYWRLGLAKTDLLKIGAALGSDVPFCLQGGTSLVRGRGEKLEQLPSLPFFWVVLALPRGVKISTALAYRSFDSNLIGKPSLIPLVKAIRLGSRKEIASWLSSGLTNTLETAILPGS